MDSPSFTFQEAVQAIKDGNSLDRPTEKLLAELSQSERLSLLDGDVPFYEGVREILCDRYNRVPFSMGANARTGIPGIQFTDGPRGVVMGASTAFPVAMARGATFDVELERRIGNAIGLEAKAQGANFFAGICVNLPRHPAWGRIQETYGEDPVLLGEFGLALTQGVQKHVMGCVKHFALNSMENARFRVDVEVEEDVLHEVYLAHFRRILEGGVASVMSSYNSVNGEWAGQSKKLLSDILREQYKFDGFVMSDFIFGLRHAALSVKNGLDIEAPFMQQRHQNLKAALENGKLEWSHVDSACRRILRKQLQFAAQETGGKVDSSVVFCEEHRKLAREAAARSMVLLKNSTQNGSNSILPINPKTISKIAVIGRLANIPNTGDKGSSQVFSPQVVTPFEGIKAAFPGADVILDDSNELENAKRIAKEVDIVICVVGYDATDEGEYVVPSLQSDPGLFELFPPAETADEKATLSMLKGDDGDDKQDSGIEVGSGGDRASLRLRSQDVDLVKAITAVNSRTVVSVIAAGAVIMEDWIEHAPAVVMSWYSGSEGGHALADVLIGEVDASGRLPFSIPVDESHLPYFDREATNIKYDRWFGQALLDKMGHKARFPLGFGLSYTQFTVSDVQVEVRGPDDTEDTIRIQAQVANTGTREGRHVLQIYGLPEIPDFPSRVLLGFSPVNLKAGEAQRVSFSVSVRPLQRWRKGVFVLPDHEVGIEISSFFGDSKAIKSSIKL